MSSSKRQATTDRVEPTPEAAAQSLIAFCPNLCSRSSQVPNHLASVAERRDRAPALQAEERVMAKSPNRLLASLSSEVFSALAPQLKTVELKFGDVVAEAGSAVRRAYFPYAGVISLVVELDVGTMIETAMVGRDGVLNAASALDGRVSLNKGIVQMAGSAGTLEVDQLRRLAARRSARFSSGMNRCCSRSRNNRRPATPATRSKPACVAGCSICGTFPTAMT